MKYIVEQQIAVDADTALEAVIMARELSRSGVHVGFNNYTVWDDSMHFQANVNMDDDPPTVCN